MPQPLKTSARKLKRVILITKRIESLRAELKALLAEGKLKASARIHAALQQASAGASGSKFFSDAARTRMAVGQRTRWARSRGEKIPLTDLTLERRAAARKKVKRKFTAAWRKKLSQSARRRWAAARAQ